MCNTADEKPAKDEYPAGKFPVDRFVFVYQTLKLMSFGFIGKYGCFKFDGFNRKVEIERFIEKVFNAQIFS